MKKGRHRRYEEARALKRGPDLDIDALFTDLEGEPVVVATTNGDGVADDESYTYDASDDDGYDEDVYRGR